MLLDVSHTSHTRARTGIQRVVRSLARELAEATPITYDPWSRAWRPLQGWEEANLREDRSGRGRRGAAWPWWAQVAGLSERWVARRRAPALRRLPLDSPLLVPELFTAECGRALPMLTRALRGPKVALFHDAIALKLPELSPPGMVARFPSYLQELLAFDVVAAVSDDSRECLTEFWRWAGVASPPQVVTLPLGIDLPLARPAFPNGTFTLLCVGTMEGRKNHLSLFNACERLWAEGLSFQLEVVGHCHATTGRAARERLEGLQKSGRPIVYHGSVSDAGLEAAYARAHATVYPSWMEGFGLPVLESLARGRPCVCQAGGALGESARGGGCLTVAEPTEEALTVALRTLVCDPNVHARLGVEAERRVFRTWKDYAGDLRQLLSEGLPKRSDTTA